MKDYLSVDEMCEYFGITKNTLSAWRSEGLSLCRIGKKFYFAAKDIDLFMERHKVSEYERK